MKGRSEMEKVMPIKCQLGDFIPIIGFTNGRKKTKLSNKLNFISQTKYINEGPKNHTSKSHLTSQDFSIISIWRICESKREKREEIDRVQEYDNKTTKEHVKTLGPNLNPQTMDLISTSRMTN